MRQKRSLKRFLAHSYFQRKTRNSLGIPSLSILNQKLKINKSK